MKADDIVLPFFQISILFRTTKSINYYCWRSVLTVSTDFNRWSQNTFLWSDQTQNNGFLPKWFSHAVDVDEIHGSMQEFSCLTFSQPIHFSSLVTMQSKTVPFCVSCKKKMPATYALYLAQNSTLSLVAKVFLRSNMVLRLLIATRYLSYKKHNFRNVCPL